MTTSIKSQRDVPFFNYRGAFAARETEFVAIFRDVLHRGAYIHQRDLADFETRLASYLGVKHAFGVANATDGLIMLARAAGLRAGDEVIFPSHTMVASPASVAHVGATPVPVECLDRDHLIDPEAIERAITERTRAIIPVHLNGRTCQMDRIMDIAKRHNLLIIEDAAQALGSKFRGRYAGTFGLGAAISFYPAKILGCLGDGGAVVTNDDNVARQVRLLRDHGRNEQGEVEMWGLNSRLDNLQAAFLDAQFKEYHVIVNRRRDIAAQYQEGLGNISALQLPPGPNDDKDHFDVFQNYELQADRRDALRAHLSQHGVGTLLQWGGKAVHQFRGLGFTQSLPRTERFFQRCIMLPMNTTIGDEDVAYVVSRIRDFYGA
jgi:dTDP-4-amino-4,6-dideoxygalactose transaminase